MVWRHCDNINPKPRFCIFKLRNPGLNETPWISKPYQAASNSCIKSIRQVIQHVHCSKCRMNNECQLRSTEENLPRISFTVPAIVRAMLRGRIVLAMSRITSNVKLPLCLTEAYTQQQLTFEQCNNVIYMQYRYKYVF